MSAQEQKSKYQRVFESPQDGDIVQFTMERKHEHWLITCKELPGLFLCSEDMDEVLDQIKPSINGLWEVIQNPEKYRADVPQAHPPQAPAEEAANAIIDQTKCHHGWLKSTKGTFCFKCKMPKPPADSTKEAAKAGPTEEEIIEHLG